jgi:hypothetical protein
MSIRPYDENFDFISDKGPHQWLDEKILKPAIDPSGLGKRIKIEFREGEKEKVPVKPKYEFANYLWDRADSIMPDINVTKGILSAMLRTADMLPLMEIYPSIENLAENDIRVLMNSGAYRTSGHPDQEAVHALIARWFEKKYNGPVKKPALRRNSTGPVHVRAHTREEGREKIKAHDRARPVRRNRASE